nr:hypothetical protein [Tanacetum cinerariifolium]
GTFCATSGKFSTSSGKFPIGSEKISTTSGKFSISRLKVPVNSGTHGGTKDIASQEVTKDVPSLRYIALPNWAHDALLEFTSSKPQDHCSTEVSKGSGNTNPTASTPNPPADHIETLIVETPILTVSSPVPTAYSTDSQDPSSNARLISKRVANQEETPSLDNILSLPNQFEDILGGTTNSDESNGEENDTSNMETAISASPTPTLRIHKDHPKSQINSHVDTLIQTRNKSKEVGDQSFTTTIHQKTDPALLQFCLFSCLLSQVEPKKNSDALQDPSWVEAMQEELFQFKIQNVWTLVDCPKGMDVKSALLYGTIDEEVYVMQPPGFQDPEFPAKVYKVEKAMYGLHQAPRAWYGTLLKYLLKNGFQRGTIDQTLFIRKQREDFILVQVYVDDIIFGSSNPSSNTPMDKENPWGKDRTGKDVDLYLYRSMIGSLMYLTASRLDIMFAVCACTRHQVTPKECHLHVVKRIFRYLKGHPKLGLWYRKESPFDLVAFSDSDYGGATQDRKSTTGGCQFLGRRHHFIRDYFEKKLISVDHTPTDENVADLLTKPFDAGRFQYLVVEHAMGGFVKGNIIIYTLFGEFNVNFHPMVDFIEASPLRIETMDEGTQILATVDGITKTVTESSLRRNVKLQDEEGISSLPDTELFENLTLMGYNISPNQKFIFQKGMSQFAQITHSHTYVVPFHTRKLFTTLRVNSPSFSRRIVPLFDTMLVQQGEGSGTPTEPHHTPSPKAPSPSHTSHTSPSLPPVSSTSIPTVTPTETTPIKQYTRKARIAQSSALPTVADEPASPQRDVSQGKACLTDSGFIADQDRANIAKTSTLPHESTSRVTSLAADEGTRVKFLEDRQGEGINLSRDDALIKGRRLDEKEVATKMVSSDTKEIRLDEGEVAAKKGSDDTEEMATVLIIMDAASVLSSGGVQVVPTAAAVAPANVSISTGSGVVPTASTTTSTATPIFTTATTVTPYTKRKGKEKMVETHTPKKKKRLQEQIDIQDEEIAKIYAEEELKQMIEGLDRSNETVAKHLEEYDQAVAELTIRERIKLISELVKYQDHHSKILQYQDQQRKTRTKKQKGDFYMAVIRSNLGWKKISEEVPEEVKSSDEVPKEKIKELIQLVPIEEVYVEALQVKHPIIDWKVHTEGQRSYWKITRLGGSLVSYQFFVDMLKQIDREDLNQLWALVKETLSIRPATNKKEMELWVELKRLYEPDVKDHLWTHTQHIMHAPIEWRLYDTCGVHHVMFKDLEIFMLVEKNYPLRKALALVMICYKLQVENYSQKATDLVRKIQQIVAGASSLGEDCWE